MKRRWNLLLPAGFLLALLAFFSYFMFFARFPVTRDFPWANLLLFVGAFCLLGLGLRRAFRQPQTYRGKVSGVILTALSTLVLGLFLAYNFYLSSQLPSSLEAPQVGQKARDFTLPDVHDRPVSLSELLSAPVPSPKTAAAGNGARKVEWVLLVFYRGYW